MMRLIKAFLTGLSGLFIIVTLFSLLIPARVRVSRAVIIDNVSDTGVFLQVANGSNWRNWHPVFTLDAARFDTQAPATPKSGYRILHRGKPIILSFIAADSTSVRFLLQTAGENGIENEIVITDLPDRHAVQVEWRAITKLEWYPWQKFYGIFIDRLTGPGYEQALNGLKSFLEKR